jgi:hypothetical protein
LSHSGPASIVPSGNAEWASRSNQTRKDEPRKRRNLTIPIEALVPGESPRSDGVDEPHVLQLAETDAALPPILVDRASMKVIDGMHRLLAALMKGRSDISVEFFDGSPDDAFLRAVEANVTHGLPLSAIDRRAAAARIVASHPHLSDRAIARISGLGTKAVATIRRRSSDGAPQLDARIGQDGRVRPLNPEQGRRRAVEVLNDRPNASLREVARLAGISPTTARDVRRKLEAGEISASRPSTSGDLLRKRMTRAQTPEAKPERRSRPEPVDPESVLEILLRDPSLRHKEGGRHLLRLLQQNAIGAQERSDLATAVPPHCGALVAKLARQFAETWLGFARELDERVRIEPNGAPTTEQLASLSRIRHVGHDRGYGDRPGAVGA